MSLLRRIFSLDLRSLAACRIATGLVILVDVLVRAKEFRLFYTSSGILPRLALFEINPPTFPVAHLLSDMTLFQVLLFALHALAAIALMVGYRTRLATVLCWYLCHSLMLRNYLVNNGGDNVLVCMLFWCMFLPWGERASLDALARTHSDPPPQSVFSVASVGLINQVVLIYWVSVYFKMESTWLSGQAVYYALQSDLYSQPTRHWLLPYPQMLQALCYLTLIWELVGPLLLLSPWPWLRVLALIPFSLMHFSFGFFLRLGIFAFSPQLNFLAMLPGGVWTRLGRRWSSQPWQRWGQQLNGWLSTPDPGPGWQVPSQWWAPGLALMLYSWMSGLSNDQTARPNPLVPRSLTWVGEWTGLRQRWSVFVKLPENTDGWVLVEGQLEDGSTVDLFQGRDPFTWKKPVPVSELHPNFRWPTPLLTICSAPHLQPWFVQALAWDWNDRHPTRKVRSARLYMVIEPSLPDYRDSPPQSRKLLDWTPP